MIFRFVVKHCRWLGRLPLMPHLFDAFLLTVTALTDRGKLRAIEALEERAVDKLGARRSLHRFGGMGFVVGDCELGHIHGNGLFDALIGRANRETLVLAGKALPHHVFPNSGWISFWIKEESDVDRAMDLLRLALHARG